TIDAAGCVVAPGLVDIHCHFREPGFESKETIASGSRAAAKGGFTTVVTMANTNPPIDNAGLLELIIKRAREEACIRVRPAACATKGLRSEEITEMADLKDAGAVAITDDGHDIASSRLMRHALEYAGMVDMPFLSHCEDEALSEGGVMNEGYMAALMGLPGTPKAAEEVRIDRNIRLAELAGAHIHIQHVSTAAGVEIIRQAKRRGARVTGESAPHYFCLTDEAVRGFNTNAKMNPPLREPEDVAAVIEAFKDGTLDCIATDHAPHTLTEKRVEFALAPFGIIGLETSLALTLTHLVQPGHISLEHAVRLLTLGGARVCNIAEAGTIAPGAPADIVVFNPDAEWTVAADSFASKSGNSPFIGYTLKGKVTHTLCGGKVVYCE
ncbi:MAG TPA: dihydroorotase, partial [Candidatus Hydrogenedentes bacterium]|nr:dihydroorotase [Candidatus Hydrogenedentota bacterium]